MSRISSAADAWVLVRHYNDPCAGGAQGLLDALGAYHTREEAEADAAHLRQFVAETLTAVPLRSVSR